MDGSSFVGFRRKGKIVTNREAASYLNRLFMKGVSSLPGIGDDAEFISESEAKELGIGRLAGEGNTRSDFDIEHGGIRHVVESLVVVGYDEFFDDARADEPADAYHFLCTAAAIDHEIGHAYQHMVLERNGSELGRVFFLNQWGTFGSQKFADSLYDQDVNEIGAQYLALKKLGLHVSHIKGFGLVNIEHTDKGFVDRGAVEAYSGLSEVDAALCFYQDRRHEGVTHDFIGYPAGGYRSARSIFRKFESSFEKAVYADKNWTKDVRPDEGYKDLDDYVNRCDDEVLSELFRVNSGILEKFKAEKDGFQQGLILAALTTVGRNDKTRQDTLQQRILDEFGVDVFAKDICGRSIESRQKALPPVLGVGGKIARRAVKQMKNDVVEQLRVPDIDFDGR